MKLCVKLVIYKDHARMHGQQNIKVSDKLLTVRQGANISYLESLV